MAVALEPRRIAAITKGTSPGYFIESAINHYTLTSGKDLRLYNAAKKLADCWVANIGPGKKVWFDGHQEMEQALVRFGRFVNDMEGTREQQGQGDAYIALARFLLESRRGGSEYDQSHLPPQQQYEAVGHAVRAVYFYSGMADIAAETHDRDYQSAVRSLWDNIVNRKYYVTGGIGSGETSEGFGADYLLRQQRLLRILLELRARVLPVQAQSRVPRRALRRSLRGDDVQRAARRNRPRGTKLLLHESAREHRAGGMARVSLLRGQHPAHAAHAADVDVRRKTARVVYVNLFVGSRINVGEVAGTPVEMVQETDYPWNGEVAITRQSARRAQVLREGARARPRDECAVLGDAGGQGTEQLRVNGAAVDARIEHGYAVITREWRRGDRIELRAAARRRSESPRTSALRPRAARWRCVTDLCFTTSSLRTSRASIEQSGKRRSPRNGAGICWAAWSR